MVESHATKPEIRKALKEIYKVDAVQVNIVNRPPKRKKRLRVSPNTVRTHVQGIFSKLQVHSRLEAAAFAVRHDLVKPAPSSSSYARP